jgi:cytochrome c-type biogenesis protein CcmH/NrfG
MMVAAAALWTMSSLLAAAQASPPTAASHTPAQGAATKARLAGRLDEAIAKYRHALQATPAWSEGWYFLGTIYYERNNAKGCADAFSRFVKLQPKVALGHAFHGLCLYNASDHTGALAALDRAERIGLPKDDPLTDIANYHAALLYTRDGNFEQALQMLSHFAQRKSVEPRLIELAGIASLRRPIAPADVPEEDRELIYRTGRAVMTAGARSAAEASVMFRELTSDFPKALNLHYVYGSFLLGAAEPDAAIREFEAELNLQPGHLPTLVVLGLQYIKKHNYAEAVKFGEHAVRVAPENFTAQTVLGRALCEGGMDVPRGVAALEKAAMLEPTSPQVRIALASAYAKAGRNEDASRQRAEFMRLKKQAEQP